MFSKRTLRRLIFGLIALVLVSFIALTASNTVAESGLELEDMGVDALDMAPPECASLGLDNVIITNGFFVVGTGANDLILAGTGVNWIFSGDGDDCILGGGGNDWLNGGAGYDVCFGGPGGNTINCEESH